MQDVKFCAEANKKGMTTVNPATPATPSETTFDSLLKESVENEAAKQSNGSSQSLTAKERVSDEGTPQAKTPVARSSKKEKSLSGNQLRQK